MANKMIKQVAEAICKRRNDIDWPCNGLDFDEEMARVAIAAIREPTTQQMTEYSEMKAIFGEKKAFPVSEWEMMINAALKE